VSGGVISVILWVLVLLGAAFIVFYVALWIEMTPRRYVRKADYYLLARLFGGLPSSLDLHRAWFDEGALQGEPRACYEAEIQAKEFSEILDRVPHTTAERSENHSPYYPCDINFHAAFRAETENLDPIYYIPSSLPVERPSHKTPSSFTSAVLVDKTSSPSLRVWISTTPLLLLDPSEARK